MPGGLTTCYCKGGRPVFIDACSWRLYSHDCPSYSKFSDGNTELYGYAGVTISDRRSSNYGTPEAVYSAYQAKCSGAGLQYRSTGERVGRDLSMEKACSASQIS